MGDPNAGQGLSRCSQVRWDHGGRAKAEAKARREEAERRARIAAAMAKVHGGKPS